MLRPTRFFFVSVCILVRYTTLACFFVEGLAERDGEEGGIKSERVQELACASVDSFGPGTRKGNSGGERKELRGG